MSSRERAEEPLYPRLRGGRGGRGREAVARHQRGRLMGAMVEAVWRHGYRATTVGELVRLAGVSKSAFYEHFAGKEACFLATFDAAAAALRERVDVARRADGASVSSRLETALRILAEGAVEQPKVAKLMTIESFAPGPVAVAHRDRFLAFLEEAVAEALYAPGAGPDPGAPDPLPRAVAGGLCHAAYACMRDGRMEALAEGREGLLEWALSYRDAEPLGVTPDLGSEGGAAGAGAGVSRRDMIGRAAVEVVAERGYAALTIPLISAHASSSNQTFYEHFESKEEAFLAGFDLIASQVRRATAEAFESRGSWVEGIVAATQALLERIANDELLASVALFELPTLGVEAVESRGLIRTSLGVLLKAAEDGGGSRQRPSDLVLEAVQGGIATVVQHELAAGRVDSLPTLSAAIAQFAVVPFGALSKDDPEAPPQDLRRLAVGIDRAS